MAGLGWWALAWALAHAGPIHGIPFFGYGAALCLVLGGAFVTPLAGTCARPVVDPLAAPRLGGGAPAGGDALGDAGTHGRRRRALMTALAMMVSVIVMVGSFRRTVERWIEATITADLYLTPGSRPAVGPSAHFADDAVVAAIASVPGVAAVDPYRQIPIEANGQPLLVSSRDARIVRDRSGMQFEHGDPNAILDRLANGKASSSPKSWRAAWDGAGESLRLPTPDGPASFPILAVFYDSRHRRRTVLMDRSVFVRYWRDRGVTAAAVYVGEEADPERARRDRRRAGASAAAITSNRAQAGGPRVFDQTLRSRARSSGRDGRRRARRANTVLTIALERRREGACCAPSGRPAQVGGIVVRGGAHWTVGIGVGRGRGFAVSLVLIRS
jgi:putative ABC transport system permease protein